jgi:mannose-6-phosphate isomerase
MSASAGSSLLPIRLVEKPWGQDVLPPPFQAPEGQRIGEIWFEPPPELPELLVKYIFTSDKLSVQVHPSDAQTLAAGIGRQGKEECWLVIAAEPGAKLGIGLSHELTKDAMRSAAHDGSIEAMLDWYDVGPGDFFYIPANTVHAIGAGVSIIEIQQNSDITYRLYDYGRPREIHVDQAVAVAKSGPLAPSCRKKVPDRGAAVLVDGPLFRVNQVQGSGQATLASAYPGPLLVIPRHGTVEVRGAPVTPGQCALALSSEEIGCSADTVWLAAAAC